ncbi:MAG: hypothetical protein AVDCRST_MAG01-01-3057, partial [uncultured Rubrobacteraceae bacterium]
VRGLREPARPAGGRRRVVRPLAGRPRGRVHEDDGGMGEHERREAGEIRSSLRAGLRHRPGSPGRRRRSRSLGRGGRGAIRGGRRGPGPDQSPRRLAPLPGCRTPDGRRRKGRDGRAGPAARLPRRVRALRQPASRTAREPL